MEPIEIKIETVDDLLNSFIKIYLSNGCNALWALDTLEYQFYTRINEAKQKDIQKEFIKAMRLLHGEKQTMF